MTYVKNLSQERKIILLDSNGNQKGEENLPDSVVIENNQLSIPLIHHVLEAERWNRRQGTRKTKTRSEVRGGGKKPYRQKGTGYARQGSIRAPQFRGGAVVFGPKPQDFFKKVNPKMRKLAFRHLINLKSAQKILYVIDGFSLETYSTKQVYTTLKNAGLVPGNVVALVYHEEEPYLYKSANNIALLKMVCAQRPTYPEMFYNSILLFTKRGYEDYLKIIEKKEV